MSSAWVFGGGGARGAAQVGVVRALLEAGVEPPGRIIGVSVGALNGVALAARPTLAGVQRLYETWLSKRAAQVFQLRPLQTLVARLSGRLELSLLPAISRHRLIEHHLALIGVERFEELELQLEVEALDLGAAEPQMFSSGLLVPPLLASTAIPGVFPAVLIGDRTYIDGGVCNNDPIDYAVESGAQEVVAIHLMATKAVEGSPRRLSEMLFRTASISLHRRLLADFSRVCNQAKVTVLCPLLSDRSTWDMRRDQIERIVEAAYQSAFGLLRHRGQQLFAHSEVHYLDLGLSGI